MTAHTPFLVWMAIVGTLLFRGPPDATIFTPMLGADAGTIGYVGVAAAAGGPVWLRTLNKAKHTGFL